MIKDYRTVETGNDSADETLRVEEFWTKQFQGQLADSNLIQELKNRDEQHILLHYLANLDDQSRILDGGCGRGEWTVYLSHRGYPTVGLDISRELIESLKKQFPELDFRCGDLRDTEFSAQSFDLVFSWGAIEHFEMGLEPCLKEMHRILKPGGLLLFTVPFANLRQLRRMDRELLHDYGIGQGPREQEKRPLFYQWRFSRGELAREVSLSGFELLQLHPIHADEGLRRMFQHDFKWSLRPGSRLEQAWIQLFRHILPCTWVAHMLCAVARRRG